MKIKFLSIAFLLYVFSFCSWAQGDFTITQVEKAGFNKEKQKLFQMIGAVDGWSGTWEGERVEVYQYASSEAIPFQFFETITDEGNISGWQDKCSIGNLFMVSKGTKACVKLVSFFKCSSSDLT